ncbi:MAG: hypothetical protein JO296_04375 [Pseudonocardiales bacterium]|nr:hypothetical protein [Pseudonocardiales bacterium]MBV9649359.1 hypothetical protein [Pseudonocardiales bacterium]
MQHGPVTVVGDDLGGLPAFAAAAHPIQATLGAPPHYGTGKFNAWLIRVLSQAADLAYRFGPGPRPSDTPDHRWDPWTPTRPSEVSLINSGWGVSDYGRSSVGSRRPAAVVAQLELSEPGGVVIVDQF